MCVPIVYENDPLGLLLVDNFRTEKTFNQSDIYLMQGVASQISISINNALFHKILKESKVREQNLRQLYQMYTGDNKIREM